MFRYNIKPVIAKNKRIITIKNNKLKSNSKVLVEFID